VRVSDFNYDLPPELIAQKPLAERDASRMMVVFRQEEKICHSRFKEFPDYLKQGDVLVLNNTKVIPAKVWGKKDGKDVEFLLIKEKEKGVWDVLCRPAKRVKTGDRIEFGPGFRAEVIDAGDEGRRTLKFSAPDVLGHLKKIGFAPLPPYIKRKKENGALRPQDLERYQTIFAEKEGAIAAPTAGLHFTPKVLKDIREKEVLVTDVTLDVGLATFQPMRVERIEDHKMLEETYSISEGAAAAINQAKKDERPVVAVGTTVVRSLESAAANVQRSKKEERSAMAVGKAAVRTLESAVRISSDRLEGDIQISSSPSDLKRREEGHQFVSSKAPSNFIQPGPGTTSLFIYPGYEFKVVDRLLTNFHLPKSTLLMLIAAFAGRDLILAAYREAVREKYRFFSYGDCMLIL
jgi:S-adenosylmethionine:tRNA ribosyltransferase-isomerase